MIGYGPTCRLVAMIDGDWATTTVRRVLTNRQDLFATTSWPGGGQQVVWAEIPLVGDTACIVEKIHDAVMGVGTAIHESHRVQMPVSYALRMADTLRRAAGV